MMRNKAERVYTVWDYFDGPRSGVADYMSTPHYYLNEFDQEQDDYSEIFLLKPIDNETFQLVLEQWEILRKWELALHRGEVAESSNPALPNQDARYSELGAKIKGSIDANSSEPIALRAEFCVRSRYPELPNFKFRELEVLWLPCNPTTIDLNELERRFLDLDLSPMQESTASLLVRGQTVRWIATLTDRSEEEVNFDVAAIEKMLRRPPPDATVTVTPPRTPRPSPLNAARDPNDGR